MRLIIILIYISINSLAQERVRPVLWIGPMDSIKVAGVNITPLVFKLAENTTINGMNIEGIGIPFLLYMIPIDPNDRIDSIVPERKFNVNGMSISPFGLLHKGRLNGLAISPWMSYIDEVNGVSISATATIVTRYNGLMITLYWNSVFELKGVQLGAINKAKKVKGIQIGIINTTKSLKGFQVGLWNSNSKRKLPIINWNLKT